MSTPSRHTAPANAQNGTPATAFPVPSTGSMTSVVAEPLLITPISSLSKLTRCRLITSAIAVSTRMSSRVVRVPSAPIWTFSASSSRSNCSRACRNAAVAARVASPSTGSTASGSTGSGTGQVIIRLFTGPPSWRRATPHALQATARRRSALDPPAGSGSGQAGVGQGRHRHRALPRFRGNGPCSRLKSSPGAYPDSFPHVNAQHRSHERPGHLLRLCHPVVRGGAQGGCRVVHRGQRPGMVVAEIRDTASPSRWASSGDVRGRTR